MARRVFKLFFYKGYPMTHLTRESFPYLSTARAAHDMADLLKRVRPELRDDVDVLQSVVTNSHRRLDDAASSPTIAQAWCDMSAAYRTLLDLRHQGKA